MFARGVYPENKVSSWCYDESEEDFTKGEYLPAANLCSDSGICLKNLYSPHCSLSNVNFYELNNRLLVDAKELDTWVLSRLRETLQNATEHPGSALDRNLRQEGVVIFLHLLGLDTTGHSYRPFSKVRIFVLPIITLDLSPLTFRSTCIILCTSIK
jgi:hypothetical protein